MQNNQRKISSIGRPLNSYKEVKQFLEEIVDIKKMIQNKDIFTNNKKKNESFFNRDLNEIETEIVKKVYDANCDMNTKFQLNTFDHEDFRLKNISQSERIKLEDFIINNAINQKVLADEEKITTEIGGLLPSNKEMDDFCLNKDRIVFYLIGLPASGKSTIAVSVANRMGCITLDSDIIKRKIPEFHCRNGASLVHKESKYIIDTIRNLSMANGYNILEPIIGENYVELCRLIKKMEKEGYNVVVIHTKVDVYTSVYRATKRFIETGRYVPINKIVDYYGENTDNTFNGVKDLLDIPCLQIDTSNKNQREIKNELKNFLKSVKLKYGIKKLVP